MKNKQGTVRKNKENSPPHLFDQQTCSFTAVTLNPLVSETTSGILLYPQTNTDTRYQ